MRFILLPFSPSIANAPFALDLLLRRSELLPPTGASGDGFKNTKQLITTKKMIKKKSTTAETLGTLFQHVRWCFRQYCLN